MIKIYSISFKVLLTGGGKWMKYIHLWIYIGHWTSQVSWETGIPNRKVNRHSLQGYIISMTFFNGCFRKIFYIINWILKICFTFIVQKCVGIVSLCVWLMQWYTALQLCRLFVFHFSFVLHFHSSYSADIHQKHCVCVVTSYC